MARSYKKNPHTGNTTASSEKQDKRRANKRLRQAVREALDCGWEMPTLKEVSNQWSFAKDGKHRVTTTEKLRK